MPRPHCARQSHATPAPVLGTGHRRHQEMAPCGGRGWGIRTCTLRCPLYCIPRGTADQVPAGAARAQSQSGQGSLLRPPSIAGSCREAPSVRRPGSPRHVLRLLDSARWTPDGPGIGGRRPALDLAQSPPLSCRPLLLPTWPWALSPSRVPRVRVPSGTTCVRVWWWQSAGDEGGAGGLGAVHGHTRGWS